MISASKINTMRNFLLLFLSLITGCQAYSEVKGCRDGWVEFTCKYPEPNETYKNITVGLPWGPIRSNKTDVWENKGRFSLYHDTKNKKLNVNIRRLQHNDSGKYQCMFQGSKRETVKLQLEDGCQAHSEVKGCTDGEENINKTKKNECQEPFIQTAYRTANTTISCGYKGNSTVSKFYCKDNGYICENIVSTRSSLRSNGTFTLTESNSSFTMSISNVSSQHAGVYWCGVERNGGCNRAALRNITLKVEDTITNFRRSPMIGQNFTYWCDYSKEQPDNQIKFICKGEDPSICEPLVTTKQNTGRFSMKDNKEMKNITITVRDVTSEDTGTYWCGAKTSSTTRSNPFFHRFVMTVGCQAYSEVKGCRDGWVEFTCKYPEPNETYKNITVGLPWGPIRSNKTDVWENKGRFSLYHDTKNKKLNVNIRRLQHNDSGKYQCMFQGSKRETVKLQLEDGCQAHSEVKGCTDGEENINKTKKNECQEPFIQTVYRTANTTISCGYKGNSEVKFFCRDNGSICENIVSTRSSLRSNGTFTLTESNSSFTMSISNVSSQHAGVYWCGVERKGGCNRAALRNITLKVEDIITNFRRSPMIGQNFTYWCDYSGQPDNQIKFICKGEDPSICEPLVTTKQNTGRFSMEDDKEKRNITITVRDVTSEDTGTYWCGAKTSDTTRSNPFFHRLVMTAGELSDYFMVCNLTPVQIVGGMNMI
ncbi:polymeric immunoglobulin receptor-like [Sebastes fasciatus]|uniref:polymeric immunoglobulin receptor-like n=1 Tax=Sebastes fasciatus TaxID=394691 RepID=UPI003D9EAB6B